jgi:hypothetical protein
MYFFTADEHYGHRNIIEYCNRPFRHVGEMDQTLIEKHNEVVGPKDTVVHVGDFSMTYNRRLIENAYIKRLNGNHVFIRGSHDYWLDQDPIEIDTGQVRDIWEKRDEPGRQELLHCSLPLRHADLAKVPLWILAGLWPYPWENARRRQADGCRR